MRRIRNLVSDHAGLFAGAEAVTAPGMMAK
jgi:hypothetical protein